ncbi:hypothetical protein HK405_002381, partial [Cladochytrium tenue]
MSIPESSIRSFQRAYRGPQNDWVREYVQGAAMEIYPVVLGREFAGLTFAEASERLFLRHKVLLFALATASMTPVRTSTATPTVGGSRRSSRRSHRSITVNPTRHVLRGSEVAYVIARDAAMAESAISNAAWLHRPPSGHNVPEWDRDWSLPAASSMTVQSPQQSTWRDGRESYIGLYGLSASPSPSPADELSDSDDDEDHGPRDLVGLAGVLRSVVRNAAGLARARSASG